MGGGPSAAAQGGGPRAAGRAEGGRPLGSIGVRSERSLLVASVLSVKQRGEVTLGDEEEGGEREEGEII